MRLSAAVCRLNHLSAEDHPLTCAFPFKFPVLPLSRFLRLYNNAPKSLAMKPLSRTGRFVGCSCSGGDMRRAFKVSEANVRAAINELANGAGVTQIPKLVETSPVAHLLQNRQRHVLRDAANLPLIERNRPGWDWHFR